MRSDPSTPPESKTRKYLKMLKVNGFIALGMLILFSGFGFFTGGVPGLINRLSLGLIVSAIGLPFLGMIVSLTCWSRFACGWGEE